MLMREAMDTAPRNGDFVILEDGARGTIAVARWSVEAGQWLDEHGKRTQINATHWHPRRTAVRRARLVSSTGRTFWHSLTLAQSVGKTGDEPGLALLFGASFARVGRPPKLLVYRLRHRCLGLVLAFAAVAEPARRADLVQQRLVAYERREVEHPPVATALAGRRVHALGGQTVIAQVGGSGGGGGTPNANSFSGSGGGGGGYSKISNLSGLTGSLMVHGGRRWRTRPKWG